MNTNIKSNKAQMHHFDVEDAMKYGVEKAVVLSNIRFWLNNNKNKDLSAVKHDGYYWMYNTARDMSNVLPYFTQSKVQRLLKQLEDDGILIVGNYNKVKYDRTKWYTLSEFTYDENCSTQTPELIIGNEQIEQPIQDSKTNTKTNNKINIPFSDFWDKYDYCKGKKSDVEDKWIALTDEERTLTMESLDTYLLSTPDKAYRKYPMSYLNTEAWNEEHIVPSDRVSNTPTATTSTSQTYSNNNSNNVYSASFKPFEENSSNHIKDELESNLEALGIALDNASVIGVVDNSTDTTDAHNNNTDIVVVEALAISSQVHWSELKAKGLLKSNKNPTAIAPNTSKSKEIDDFLSKFSSKSKYNSKNIISGNSVIDNDCIS